MCRAKRNAATVRPEDCSRIPQDRKNFLPRFSYSENLLRRRAGCGSFTLAVSNIDEIIARAQKLGIDTSHKSSSPKVKTLMITDPDGNHIAFAQTFDKTMAR